MYKSKFRKTRRLISSVNMFPKKITYRFTSNVT